MTRAIILILVVLLFQQVSSSKRKVELSSSELPQNEIRNEPYKKQKVEDLTFQRFLKGGTSSNSTDISGADEDMSDKNSIPFLSQEPNIIVYTGKDSSDKLYAVKLHRMEKGQMQIKNEREILSETLKGIDGVINVNDTFTTIDVVSLPEEVKPYFENGKDRKVEVLVTEYIESNTTEKPDLVKVLTSIVDTMVKVHEKKIAHCDLTTNNILMKSGGEVIVFDFGNGEQCESTKMTNCLDVHLHKVEPPEHKIRRSFGPSAKSGSPILKAAIWHPNLGDFYQNLDVFSAALTSLLVAAGKPNFDFWEFVESSLILPSDWKTINNELTDWGVLDEKWDDLMKKMIDQELSLKLSDHIKKLLVKMLKLRPNRKSGYIFSETFLDGKRPSMKEVQENLNQYKLWGKALEDDHLVGWEVTTDENHGVGKACDSFKEYKEEESCYAGCEYTYINENILEEINNPQTNIEENLYMNPHVKYTKKGGQMIPSNKLVCVLNTLLYGEKSDDSLKPHSITLSQFEIVTRFDTKKRNERNDLIILVIRLPKWF
jgi:serine/threonine protein kinase